MKEEYDFSAAQKTPYAKMLAITADPDFTKLATEEVVSLNESENSGFSEHGEFVDGSDISRSKK